MSNEAILSRSASFRASRRPERIAALAILMSGSMSGQRRDALLAEIHDPNAAPERREECRDDFSGIANSYVIEEMFEGEGSAWEIMEKQGIPAVPIEVVVEMFGYKYAACSSSRSR